MSVSVCVCLCAGMCLCMCAGMGVCLSAGKFVCGHVYVRVCTPPPLKKCRRSESKKNFQHYFSFLMDGITDDPDQESKAGKKFV